MRRTKESNTSTSLAQTLHRDLTRTRLANGRNKTSPSTGSEQVFELSSVAEEGGPDSYRDEPVCQSLAP